MLSHKVFVQGVPRGVNPFDQWGVDLGKQLAGRLLPVLRGEGEMEGLDASIGAILHGAENMVLFDLCVTIQLLG